MTDDLLEYDIFRFMVTSKHNGGRIDKFITENMTDITRGQVKKLCERHHVFISETAITDSAYKVKMGQEVVIQQPKPQEQLSPQPENIPIDIIFEDDNILIVHKPAGMSVHAGAGINSGTLVNALIYHTKGKLSDRNTIERPGIVHRLDKDTSGVMVVAKTNQAYDSLFEQFFNHSIKRVYYAIVRGDLKKNKGQIKTYIGRNRHDRKKMAVVGAGGKLAVTNWTILEKLVHKEKNILSLVSCQLETGRTHQIRIHMTHLGCPIIGDPVYGGHDVGLYKFFPKSTLSAVKEFPRQALHAGVLGLRHPITNDYIEFNVLPPQDFLSLASICGFAHSFDNQNSAMLK